MDREATIGLALYQLYIVVTLSVAHLHNDLRKGDKHPTYTPVLTMAPFIFFIKYAHAIAIKILVTDKYIQTIKAFSVLKDKFKVLLLCS